MKLPLLVLNTVREAHHDVQAKLYRSQRKPTKVLGTGQHERSRCGSHWCCATKAEEFGNDEETFEHLGTTWIDVENAVMVHVWQSTVLQLPSATHRVSHISPLSSINGKVWLKL